MKKLIVLLCALLLVGCGSKAQPAEPPQTLADPETAQATAATEPTQPTAPQPQVDVDLTTLSSTMVYSEVFSMLTRPSDYLGKTVKMKGNFSVYYEQPGGKNYYACLIADATSCCSQGLEFVLAGDHAYPQDYPELASEITVVGTFDTYEEYGNTYCQLIDAALLEAVAPQPSAPE